MPQRYRWDAFEVLDVHPDTLDTRCVGEAKTCGRRCRNPIAAHNLNDAFVEMQALGKRHPRSRETREAVRLLASRMLCRKNHQYQVPEVASAWIDELNALERSQYRVILPRQPRADWTVTSSTRTSTTLEASTEERVRPRPSRQPRPITRSHGLSSARPQPALSHQSTQPRLESASTTTVETEEANIQNLSTLSLSSDVVHNPASSPTASVPTIPDNHADENSDDDTIILESLSRLFGDEDGSATPQRPDTPFATSSTPSETPPSVIQSIEVYSVETPTPPPEPFTHACECNLDRLRPSRSDTPSSSSSASTSTLSGTPRPPARSATPPPAASRGTRSTAHKACTRRHAHRQALPSPCSICFEPMTLSPSSRSTPDTTLTFCKNSCGHNFHQSCIDAWSQSQYPSSSPFDEDTTTCPDCRAPWGKACAHDGQAPPVGPTRITGRGDLLGVSLAEVWDALPEGIRGQLVWGGGSIGDE